MAILGRRLNPADRPVGEPPPPRNVPARRDGDRAASLHVVTGRDGKAWDTAGENSRTAKLSAADVAAIRADRATPSAVLAARYGVSQDTVQGLWRGEGWSNT